MGRERSERGAPPPERRLTCATPASPRTLHVAAISATLALVDDRFINRELSWLAFNDRVLALATEPGIPLLERAKFCAITSSNLDEFFQVRVAALKDQVAAKIEEPTP